MTKPFATLQYLSAAFLLLVFLGAAVPLVIRVFYGDMPYLHNLSLFTRVTIAFLLWCAAIVFYLLVSTKKQKESVLFTIKYKLKDWVGASLGVLLFSFTMGWLSPNTLGMMVRLAPNTPYLFQVEIANAYTQGSRHKSLGLHLKSKDDGSLYYLTLSKRQFEYQNIKVGDRLTLKCKRNVFGIYVEGFVVND